MIRLLVCLFTLASVCSSQQYFTVFREHFDSSTPPALPTGWMSSTNRSAAGDFVLSHSSPRSSPSVVFTSNPTITQTLTSDAIEFSDCTPARLEFYTSRSSTHTSGLVVEASLDDGLTFPIALTDTIRNPGTSGYVLTAIPLQPFLRQASRVRFRWKLVGIPGAGTSGTFRLDDVMIHGQFTHDLGITQLTAVTSENGTPSATQTVTLSAIIKNSGATPAENYRVDFFGDENRDRLAEEGEKTSSQIGALLMPGDSALFTATALPIRAGENQFICTVSSADDRNPSNDTSLIVVQGRASVQTLVINEIMYDPLTDQNEWLELYHRGTIPVDIARWRVSDRPTTSGVNSFTLPNTLVRPGSFVLIAADSTILSRYFKPSNANQDACVIILNRPSGFGFNNDADCVVIRDPLGTTIDSVSYLSAWHHPDIVDPKGRSLERINPDLASNDQRNWSTSSSHDGGSPGRRNGVFTTLVPTSASLSISPNPFSPDGDGFEDFCVIRYNLPSATPIIRISIFDTRGRLIRYLANTELSGAQGEIVWDGLDDSRQRARIGPYVVYLEASDGRTSVLVTSKAVVVVATKL